MNATTFLFIAFLFGFIFFFGLNKSQAIDTQSPIKFNFFTAFNVLHIAIFLYLLVAYILFIFPQFLNYDTEIETTAADILLGDHIIYLFVGFVFGSGWRFLSISHDFRVTQKFSDLTDPRLDIITNNKFKLMIYYSLFGGSTGMGWISGLLIFHFVAKFADWFNDTFSLTDNPFFLFISLFIAVGFSFILVISLGLLMEYLEKKYKIYKWFFPNAKGGWEYIHEVYQLKKIPHESENVDE